MSAMTRDDGDVGDLFDDPSPGSKPGFGISEKSRAADR